VKNCAHVVCFSSFFFTFFFFSFFCNGSRHHLMLMFQILWFNTEIITTGSSASSLTQS
jgi:hypothetical protein